MGDIIHPAVHNVEYTMRLWETADPKVCSARANAVVRMLIEGGFLVGVCKNGLALKKEDALG